MHPTTLAAALALFLPGAGTLRAPAHASLPWLYNLDGVVAATGEDLAAAVPEEVLGDLDPECGVGARTTLALRADVGPAAGIEHVVASYAGGITVFDVEGHPVATTAGYPCAGSADQLDVVAAGTAFGTPTIAVAMTTGGRREALTWLGLYRVGHHGRLEAVFSGAVEYRDDDRVQRGSVTILPGALLHREPTSEVIVWTWDASGGVYVPHPLREPGIPHS